MDTIKSVFDFVVAGVLVGLALLLLAFSIFPAEMQEILDWTIKLPFTNENVLFLLFIAITYVIGVISEFVGLIIFEWLLDRIKRERLLKYIRLNHNSLNKSAILDTFIKPGDKAIDIKTASNCMGEMRFYILMSNPTLSQDIESQINRVRVIRVTFIVEIILAFAILIQLLHGFSVLLILSLIFTMFVVILNFMAVRWRFHRYCRSIERSYKQLVLDSPNPEGTSQSLRHVKQSSKTS